MWVVADVTDSAETPRSATGIAAVCRVAANLRLHLGTMLDILSRHRWRAASLAIALTAATPAFAQSAPPTAALAEHALMHLLLALLVVLVFAQVMGELFRRYGQPPVVGEMFAGILLGPSLLGRISPAAMEFLLPSSVAGNLRVLAQVGVVLYMFIVGLELDVHRLRQRAGAALVISASGIAVPLLSSSMLAGFLYTRVAQPSVPPFLFGAFFCVAMSVTAFPVLARIVAERGIEKSSIGILALTCAAADDIAAWCMLSIVVSFAQAKPSDGLITVLLSLVYVGFMIVAVRPLLGRLVRREAQRDSISRTTLAVMCAALLVSALITEWIGIHALFGSFLIGALVPAESQLAKRTIGKLEDVVSVMFLPIFFAFTGLRTQLGLLSGGSTWLLCGVIVLFAFLGKAGGVSLSARLCGVPWRAAFGLGALMNTRGLMELIVLNVGLDLGIISPTLFTMMVIMALVTTCSAGPILRLLGESMVEEEDSALQPAR
jgi:Kef-type K+ transport system membrane component KefB